MSQSNRGFWSGIGLLLAVAAACGQTATDDSQTHWLGECQSSAECMAGLSCECGRCVATCSDGITCSVPGGVAATCFEPTSPAVDTLCEGAAAPPICLADCSSGGCPSGQECIEGGCVPRTGTGADAGASGGSGAGGGGGGNSNCFGPHQNAERSVEPDAVGCDCSDAPALDYCAPGADGNWHALLCVAGRWQGVFDGPCEPMGGMDCTATQSCSAGQTCAIGQFGNRQCKVLPEQATTCTNPDHPENECCTTADCAEGACYESTFYPSGVCGLGGADVVNRCMTDTCATDADCGPEEVCAWDSLSTSFKACLSTACRSSEECTAEPGGQCVWIDGGCCTGVGATAIIRPSMLACVYPSDWCRSDGDCAREAPFCVVDGARAHCAAQCPMQ